MYKHETINVKAFRQEMATKEIQRASDRLMHYIQTIGSLYIIVAIVILLVKNITL